MGAPNFCDLPADLQASMVHLNIQMAAECTALQAHSAADVARSCACMRQARRIGRCAMTHCCCACRSASSTGQSGDGDPGTWSPAALLAPHCCDMTRSPHRQHHRGQSSCRLSAALTGTGRAPAGSWRSCARSPRASAGTAVALDLHPSVATCLPVFSTACWFSVHGCCSPRRSALLFRAASWTVCVTLAPASLREHEVDLLKAFPSVKCLDLSNAPTEVRLAGSLALASSIVCPLGCGRISHAQHFGSLVAGAC